MNRLPLVLLFTFFSVATVSAQDTFSIVAVDTVTGEVGAAGASCVDLFTFTFSGNDFISELLPGVGGINTQATYNTTNQVNARNRMLAGDTPAQIIKWLIENDMNGSPDTRQYGVVRLDNGTAQTAGYTGGDCYDYKNHIAGKTYCIQGNILSGPQVLDSMEARFNREQGDLACKLMAAMQGANMIGADTRCASNGTSSLFAFIKVAKPADPFERPSFILSVKTRSNAGIEPIDSLQALFSQAHTCDRPVIEDDHECILFPVPAGNRLTIRTHNASLKTYSIRNAIGQLVAAGEMETETALSLDGLASGIYFIQIKNEHIITRKSFLKL